MILCYRSISFEKLYKKLGLFFISDKNRFDGAKGTSKLVLKAWSQLSDQEGKHKKSGMQKSQKPHEPASSNRPRPKPRPESEPQPKFEPTFGKCAIDARHIVSS
ncbi:hypothetical protein Bca4012_064504 [Brassica carinata]